MSQPARPRGTGQPNPPISRRALAGLAAAVALTNVSQAVVAHAGPRIRGMRTTNLLRALGALALAVALSVLPQLAAAGPWVPAEERVARIVTDGRVRTWPWMRQAAQAGFRDLAPLVGLDPDAHSYSIVARDLNADGWPDAFISRHGKPAELYLNEVAEGVSVGFAPPLTFRNVHGQYDRHGCTAADVDGDGLGDVYCAMGAQLGSRTKWNELWIQAPGGTFTDRAGEFGVEDIFGRGRFPAFLDLNHDPWPDLFVGNYAPRTDDSTTPNRTFVSQDGARFIEVDLGVTREIRNECTVVADYDGDGWDDLLICGGNRWFLFRREEAAFRNVTRVAGLPTVRAVAARFVHLDGDGLLDLVFATRRRLQLLLQRDDHTYGSPILRLPISHGHGLAAGDPDGDGDVDVYVVEGCVAGANMPDWLLRNERGRLAFDPLGVEPMSAGCGDTAEALDLDDDGSDEFLVVNGGGIHQVGRSGPDQLLTLGSWGIES